jgi:hypothetical protein
MGATKDRIVRLIEQAATRKVVDLAYEYVRAEPGQREDIQAALEIEQWLAESCHECLQ